jgi:hypothetical protein|tara:strand:- start:685 stop:954 length:270 start_codon:yes stop_codon:yes gene_type:complete
MTTFENDDRDFEGELAHQLAVAQVPPVPDDLDAAVRVRLNRTLQISHWITFLTAAIPMVIATMLSPIGHLLIQTLSGRTRRSSGAPEDT